MMKPGVMRKLIGTVVLCTITLILSGCMLLASNKSYATIRFNGRDYIACGTPTLDSRLPDVTSWDRLSGKLLTKIGVKYRATIYAIAGFDSGDWIYCHFEPMLGTGPQGIYHSADIKMETVEDFNPDHLDVYALTPPTATGSGSEEFYGSTSDKETVNNFVKAILSGKELSPDALLEAQKKSWTYDNSKQYRLEFTSSAYPLLRYYYDYTIGKDSKCYVLSDRVGYESEGKLLELIDTAQ